MKKLFMFCAVLGLLLGLFSTAAMAQATECYVQKDDASGFDVSPYQAALEAKACDLIAAFDSTDYADSFRVFSFGFYLNLEYYDGYSYPQAFLDMQAEVAQESPYYLLIGRQSDRTGIFTKFWIKVKLPTEGNFECLDEYQRIALDFNLKNAVHAAYEENGNVPVSFADAEQSGMDSLIAFVKKQIDCCDVEARSGCNLCLSSIETRAVVESLGFSMIDGGILQDDSSSSAPDVEDYANPIIDLDGRLQEMIQYLQAKGFSSHGYITEDSDFCNLNFETAEEQFNGNQSEFKIWWHIWRNPENNEFVVFEKISNYEDFINETIISLLSEDYWGSELPAPQCHETLRGYNIGIPNYDDDTDCGLPEYVFEGNLAHRLIESYYKEVLRASDSVAIEYAIPYSSGAGNMGYADIVNLTSGHIYEIKKEGCEDVGIIEASRYVDNANLFCNPPSPGFFKLGGGAGVVFPIFPIPPNRQLKSYWDQPGLILYNIQDNLTPDPQYVPVPNFLPQKVLEKLLKLLDRITQGVGNLEEVIATFLRENPDLAEFIVEYATGIFVTVFVVNLIQNLATAGVGFADDVFIFTALFRIVKIAKAIPKPVLVPVP